MSPEKAKLASRKNIASEILRTLAGTAGEYSKYGEAGTDLRDAPEYLLCVDLARGLTRTFSTLRYRLENRASGFDSAAARPVKAATALGKDLARFDLVLIDRISNLPRSVIEVKRGRRVLGDARRLMKLAALDHGRPRWNHGFIVTILRRNADAIEPVVDEMVRDVLALNEDPEMQLSAGQRFAVQALHSKVGDANPTGTGESIYGVVLCLSMKTTAEGGAVDHD